MHSIPGVRYLLCGQCCLLGLEACVAVARARASLACLYTYQALAIEKNPTCLYPFTGVRICTRSTQGRNLHVHNNTHFASPLNWPSHSV